MIRANIRSAIRRFVADDDAQDLVEYAYLGAFIGLCRHRDLGGTS